MSDHNSYQAGGEPLPLSSITFNKYRRTEDVNETVILGNAAGRVLGA